MYHALPSVTLRGMFGHVIVRNRGRAGLDETTPFPLADATHWWIVFTIWG